MKGRIQRRRDRGRKRNLSICSFPPQTAAITRAGPDGNQESRIPSGSPTWTAAARLLGPSSGAFPGTFAGSLIRSRTSVWNSSWCSYEMQALQKMAQPAPKLGIFNSFITLAFVVQLCLGLRHTMKTKPVTSLLHPTFYTVGEGTFWAILTKSRAIYTQIVAYTLGA